MSEDFSDSNVEAQGSKKPRKQRVKRDPTSLDRRIGAAKRSANILISHANGDKEELNNVYVFLKSFLGL